MLVFYFLALIVVWLGLLSLRNGVSFAAYVRRESSRPLLNFAPFVSVIAPCRGLDQGLPENIAALLKQDYPLYEIIFVTDRADDPSLGVIEQIISGERQGFARVLIAGDAIRSGQKVHNLRTAVLDIDPRTEVLVFVDTDARPDSRWLASLVAPLADEGIGAATGYRWFIPAAGGFASHLRSVWNASIASALGERGDKNFSWGGSTAIRRQTFEALQIRERWQGTVSDDFTMTRVLQDAKLPIQFMPACLVPSLDSCTLKELLEFTNRQLKITRVYAPHLWEPVLIGNLLFTSVFFGGLALVIIRALQGHSFSIALLMLVLIYAMGAAKSYIRLQAVGVPLQSYKQQLLRSLPAHLLLWPLASALYLWNAMVAAFSRRINWRGITYELKSATEAVIIRK
jgi:ceramide glucosyltransferase